MPLTNVGSQGLIRRFKNSQRGQGQPLAVKLAAEFGVSEQARIVVLLDALRTVTA